MKSLLFRFWQWLGRVLGQETKPSDELQTTNYELRQDAPHATTGTPTAPAAPPVTLPPPLPPQMDIHAGEQAQYGRKASIVTQSEARLYRSLLLATGSDFQVMSKVRLWDFIWLINEPPDRKQHLSRLSCRHVDFLLCEPLTLKPLMAIELDDRSHETPFGRDNDRYKDELFAAAGLPILRLSHPNFPPRRLRHQIEEKLENQT